MTNIYLITGFLGSGKTTFLNNQLHNNSIKTGVLMNEFGKVSMDTIIVDRESIDFVELKNGSIFCSCLKVYFIEGLEKLVRMNLDTIYIESSGLADPSDMNKVIEILSKKVDPSLFEFKAVICIIDGLFFEQELKMMVSVERQIQHSHHILINKSDLISERRILEIEAIIRNINPVVEISTMSFGKVDIESLNISFYLILDEESTNIIETKPKTISLKFTKEPTLNQLKTFLGELTEFFYRIKGFVHINKKDYKIDLVNSRIEIIEFTFKKGKKEIEGYNELICLSSKGVKSIGYLSTIAEKELKGIYTLQM